MPPFKTKKRTHRMSKSSDPLPLGTTTKERSCSSCRVRKVRCTGARPACAFCIKGAIARGNSPESVKCNYPAASQFAKDGDGEVEAELGGRGAKCDWGRPEGEGLEEDGEDLASSAVSSRSSFSSTSSASSAPTTPSAEDLEPLVATTPPRLASSPPPFDARLAPPTPTLAPSSPRLLPVDLPLTPTPRTLPTFLHVRPPPAVAPLVLPLVLPASSPRSIPPPPPQSQPSTAPSLPALAHAPPVASPHQPFPPPNAGFWDGGPLSREEIRGWEGLMYVARQSERR